MPAAAQLADPWTLKPPAMREQAFTLKDRDQPGVEIPVRLRQLSVPQTMAAQQEAEELIAEFVTGLDGEDPNSYPAPIPVQMSEKLILQVCYLAAMEQPNAEGRQLGFHGFLGASVTMPQGFMRLSEQATALNRGRTPPETEDDEGNRPGKARGNSSSARPSASANATPA